VAAERPAALHSAGPAGAAVAGADADADGDSDAEPDGLGDADVAPGLAEPVPGGVVEDDCGWLGPHPLSSSAAAAAAVVMANPCEIR
jgi:hypothetical protein